jgi:hypothetical protein
MFLARLSDRDAPAMSPSLRQDTTPEQRFMIEAKIAEYMEAGAYEWARRACAPSWVMVPRSRAGVQPRRIGLGGTLPTVQVIPMIIDRQPVRASGLPESALVVVGTDHRLADPEPLKAMLEKYEKASRS